MTPCPTCAWPHHSLHDVEVVCVKCSSLVQIKGVKLAEQVVGSSAAPSFQYWPPLKNETAAQFSRQRLLEQSKAAWDRLHSLESPTQQAIADWITTVPSIHCGCRQFARDYVRDNPPPYHDLAAFRRWTFDFHCSVDRKVGDTPMPWEEAVRRWGWPDEVK